MGVFTIRRTLAAVLAGLGAVVAVGPSAQADHAEYRFPLPGATSTEGIASGAGTTFYASDLFAGDIFRGDIRTGRVDKFIDNAPGRNALGLRVDLADGLLFVAGGFDGRGYVYDLDSGATIATYQFSSGAVGDQRRRRDAERCLVHQLLAGGAVLRPVVAGRPRCLQHPAPQWTGRRHQRWFQQQRHPGHRATAPRLSWRTPPRGP